MASKVTPKIHIQSVHVHFKLQITIFGKCILIYFRKLQISNFGEGKGFLTEDLCFPLRIIEGKARI